MIIKAMEFRNGMFLITSRYDSGPPRKWLKPTLQRSCNPKTKVHLSDQCYDVNAEIDVEYPTEVEASA